MALRQGAGLDEIEAAYRRLVPRLLRLARAIVGSGEDAWDVVQEAVASCIHSREQFRGTGTVEGWLWRAVVNSARTRQSASLRHRDHEIPLAAADEVGASRPDSEPREHIRAALCRLPERQRLALFLRFYADLSYETIAETLEISVGTVGPTLSQAQRRLRELLEGGKR